MNRNGIIFGVILMVICFAGCDTGLGPEGEPDTGDVVLNINPGDVQDVTGNPFLGKNWHNPDPDNGFVYVLRADGTIPVAHHCGLDFPNQFSYFIWKNIIVFYGSEMDADGLRAEIFTVEDENTIRAVSALGTKREHDYIAVTDVPELYPPVPIEIPGSSPGDPFVVSNELLGTWKTGSVTWEFKNDGTLTIGAAEYSYLVREREGNPPVLVTLAHDGSCAVKTYTFAKNGNSVNFTAEGKFLTLVNKP
jgi:hypothetical protein